MSLLFNIAEDSEPCAVGVFESFAEVTAVRIPAKDQAILRRNHRQVFQRAVKKDVAQQA